jgi:predicted Zn-dependent protease
LLALFFVGPVVPAAAVAQADQQKSAADAPQTPLAADPMNAETPPAQSQGQPPADRQKAAASGVKHPGGKDDVKAIGNRKVGGLDIYSMDTDIKIGRAAAQEIERTMRLVDDPVINEYVNRIGQNLVRNSDAKVPFTIKILDDDSINAMSLPGGILYVNSGMILAADDEAELAGAMAHEIAHVALRHGTRQMTRAQILGLATVPLIAVGGLPGIVAPQVTRMLLPATLLHFSRNFEAEADYFGTQYMYKAGYDPNALMTFFEKIQVLEKRKPGLVSQAFSTHPPTAQRMRKSQEEISTILPARERYLETTSEFGEVKGRLATLRNLRKVDPNDPTKPTLRKTAGPRSGEGEEKKDDDRPTLQRRYTSTPASVTKELLTAARP